MIAVEAATSVDAGLVAAVGELVPQLSSSSPPPDAEALDALDLAAVSYQIVLTKADKLKPAEVEKVTAETLKAVSKRPAAFPRVQATSAEKGHGLPELTAGAQGRCVPLGPHDRCRGQGPPAGRDPDATDQAVTDLGPPPASPVSSQQQALRPAGHCVGRRARAPAAQLPRPGCTLVDGEIRRLESALR